MRTWKAILRREEEIRNLKNMGLCMLVVMTLVMGAFGMALTRDLFDVGRDTEQVTAADLEYEAMTVQ